MKATGEWLIVEMFTEKNLPKLSSLVIIPKGLSAVDELIAMPGVIVDFGPEVDNKAVGFEKGDIGYFYKKTGIKTKHPVTKKECTFYKPESVMAVLTPEELDFTTEEK